MSLKLDSIEDRKEIIRVRNNREIPPGTSPQLRVAIKAMWAHYDIERAPVTKHGKRMYSGDRMRVIGTSGKVSTGGICVKNTGLRGNV